jgi:hypothetical protein
VGSRLDEVNEFFHSASNRNEYMKQKIMFLSSKARPVLRVDRFTTICEPIVLAM